PHLLKGRGQIPVVQANPRCDAGREQPINELVIKVEPLLVDCSSSLRKHARPSDGKPVGRHAEVLKQANVVGPAVIMACGRLWSSGWLTSLDLIPDARASAVRLQSPLDLQCRAGHSPNEPGRKSRWNPFRSHRERTGRIVNQET